MKNLEETISQYENVVFGEGFCKGCFRKPYIFIVVLELLKSLLPKQMTLEEVKALKADCYVWVQRNSFLKEPYCWNVSNVDKNGISVYHAGTEWYFKFETYGKYWICWTALPTKEQWEAAADEMNKNTVLCAGGSDNE